MTRRIASGGGIFGTIIVLATVPALAEVCSFTTECFEGDGCYETTFSMTIDGDTLVTDAETISVTDDAGPALIATTPSAVHVLTRSGDGAARYSTHIFDGPLMLNYLGTCE